MTAQNLAPNPSFEDIAFCPLNLTDWSVNAWYPVGGTADNFHACASPNWEGVPYNFQGFQYAHSGDAYVGGYFYIQGNNNYREFVQVPLLETLQAGHCYEVSCWINLADEGCGGNRVGFLFTPGVETNLLGMTPQVDLEMEYYADSIGWTYVSGTLIATESEAYLSIGNFHVDAETYLQPGCMTLAQYAYYYIDDVVVEEMVLGEEELDLGPPVTACDSYTIDPGFNADVFEWSDGSNGSTLTVTTSGTYSVTAYAGCTEFVGSLEVMVVLPGTVDLVPGPLEFCEGTTVTLSLDPAFATYTWNNGSTGPELIVSTPGTYSVTLDDGCHGPISDVITLIEVFPPPPFDLGAEVYLCPGDVLGFEFDPGLGDFLWQDGSTSSEYYIEEEGGYELTISNPCGMASDAIEVFTVDPVSIYLGPDTVSLCEGSVIDINLENDLATYQWQDGSTGPDYLIQSPGTYSVTATNPCGTVTASMVVLEFDPGVVDLGPPDRLACAGDTLILSLPGVLGDYLWQDGSVTQAYPVTASGTYAVTVTSPCGIASDEVTVVFADSLIVPDIGPDANLCPGQQLVLSVNSAGGTALWNDMSTADTLLVTTAGTYSVQVFNACFSYADTVVVTVSSEPPIVVLPLDFSLCAGDTVTLDAGVTGVTYVWSDGSSGQQLQVTAPGQYAVTVSSPCGADADTVLVAAGEPLPVVELGPDTAICAGEFLQVIPVATNVTGWQWQDGSTQPTWTTNAAGLITVVGTNFCGSATDTMEVSLLPATPAFSLGADTAICPGETVTLSVGLPGVDIVWHDGTTGAQNTVSAPGSYYATVSTICGTTSDTVTIGALPAIPVLDLGPDQTICPGEAVIIDPQISGTVAYLWQDGSTNTSYTATQGGWIALTITSGCGTSTDSLLLTETTDGPQLDLGPDQQVCVGETVIIDAGISGVDYEWQDGSTGSSIAVTTSGTYSLTVSNACGTDSDTVMVDISGQAPVLDLGPDTLLCEGDVLTLIAGGDLGTTVTWQDNTNGNSYLVTVPGQYASMAVNRCGTDADSISIDYLDRPMAFDLGPDTVLCPGQSVLLQAPVTTDTIAWQDGSSGMTLLADRAGIYSLRISNMCGVVTDTMEVFVQADEPMVDLGPDPVWCPSDTIVLDATQLFPAQYRWNTGAITPVLTVTQPGLYRVDVTTPCFATGDGVVVEEQADCFPDLAIYIPNVFTPNGDGINDVFRVETGPDAEVVGMEGSIFDRWGNLVHGSKVDPFTWDGNMGNNAMGPAVFIYRITIQYRAGGHELEVTLAGDVTLLR